MLYPNNIKKKYINKLDNHANRGMDLENIIDVANNYYISIKKAFIYKKPTPIGIVKVNYEKGKKIEEAYFKTQSTLDFNGIYNGYYIEFDAKETKNKTSFPLNNVHPHQITHIENIYNQGGIVFLLIMINNEYYILMGSDFLNYIKNHERKSIPYNYIKTYGYEIKYNYLKGLDYLQIIDSILGDDKNEKIKIQNTK